MSTLADRWGGFVSYLERATGRPVHLFSAKDNLLYERRVGDEEYDLVYLNPRQFAHIAVRHRYHALANDVDPLRGLIVVNKDSNARSLRDLQDKVVAMPSREAYAARILVMDHLQRRGIRVREEFTASHLSVYRAVAGNRVYAGGGVPRTLRMVDPGVYGSLRVLWSSEPSPSHPFAVHERVPAAVAYSIQRALTSMHETAEGRRILSDLGMSQLRSITDHDIPAGRY